MNSLLPSINLILVHQLGILTFDHQGHRGCASFEAPTYSALPEGNAWYWRSHAGGLSIVAKQQYRCSRKVCYCWKVMLYWGHIWITSESKLLKRNGRRTLRRTWEQLLYQLQTLLQTLPHRSVCIIVCLFVCSIVCLFCLLFCSIVCLYVWVSPCLLCVCLRLATDHK